MKNKFVAFLLAFFTGGLGIHWFYLNKPGRGVAYILFFWTFIPPILALIDSIRFAFMSEEKFDQIYN